jgi:sulfate permease, SulP family
VNFRAGDVITRQHAPADCMHFILEGRVGVKVETEDGIAIRVRSLGRRTTIGEMGLITRQPRSASIHAETECVLYELPVEAFDRLTREQPLLVQALLRYVIGLMAERLSFASRLITVLQR